MIPRIWRARKPGEKRIQPGWEGEERQGWHLWVKRVEPGRTEQGAVASTGFNKRVGSRWGLEQEYNKVSMSRQGKRCISDVIDRIYTLHPGKERNRGPLIIALKWPPSEELIEWTQETVSCDRNGPRYEVIKLTIKQKFKVVVRKDVSSAFILKISLLLPHELFKTKRLFSELKRYTYKIQSYLAKDK